MKNHLVRYGGWALIAGAAEGIGKAFSMLLAEKGQHLVMVDIHKEALHNLSRQIETTYGVQTQCITHDLEDEHSVHLCMEAIRKIDCRLMIYVAAYSKVRPFLSNNTNELKRFVHLNSMTPLLLVHDFAEMIGNKGSGGIILMSSLAGLVGPRYVAPYAATKAFNIILAEALYHEFKEKKIDIQACCAGITLTPTYLTSLGEKKNQVKNAMKAEKVAISSLQNLGRKAIHIPGWKNRLNYFFLTQILPRSCSALMVSQYMKKLYPEKEVL